MTNEERENAIRCLKMWIEREPQIQTYKTCLEALEQTTWIPVSEKMPPIAQRVLVSANNGEVFIARFHSIDKWTFEPTGIGYVYDKDNIIAWMPLPEPYKCNNSEQYLSYADQDTLMPAT